MYRDYKEEGTRNRSQTGVDLAAAEVLQHELGPEKRREQDEISTRMPRRQQKSCRSLPVGILQLLDQSCDKISLNPGASSRKNQRSSRRAWSTPPDCMRVLISSSAWGADGRHRARMANEL